MYLADFFKKQKINRDPILLDELDKLKKLRNKISAVITTNYDTFLEEHVFSNDFKVFVRQHELFQQIVMILQKYIKYMEVQQMRSQLLLLKVIMFSLKSQEN